MKFPPPSIFEPRMKIFKLNPSFKRLMEEIMPTGRTERPPLHSKGKAKGSPLGTLGTFKIPHKLSHTTRWTINPYILQTLISHPLKFHPFKVFCVLLESFINRKMGQCEWMAWMWSAHETTPFIHSASMTWLHSQCLNDMEHYWN